MLSFRVLESFRCFSLTHGQLVAFILLLKLCWCSSSLWPSRSFPFCSTPSVWSPAQISPFVNRYVSRGLSSDSSLRGFSARSKARASTCSWGVSGSARSPPVNTLIWQCFCRCASPRAALMRRVIATIDIGLCWPLAIYADVSNATYCKKSPQYWCFSPKSRSLILLSLNY